MFALTNALQDERSEKSWSREMDKWEKGIKYDWLKTVKGSNDQKDMVAARLLANKENVRAQILANRQNLKDKIALQEKLTEFKVASSENIASVNAELKKLQLDQNIKNLSFQEKKFLLNSALTKDIAASKNQTSMLNTLLSNFDDASTIAFFQTQQELGPDADINKIFGGEFLAKVAKIAETLPKDEKDTKATYSKQGFIQQQMLKSPLERKELSDTLRSTNKDYTNWAGSDDELLIDYYGKQFDIIGKK
jgi:hypothetical protein